MYFVEKTKGINFFKNFDYPLFIAVLILSAIGLLVVKRALCLFSEPETIWEAGAG
jgi:rod shape determining protein RodA